MKRAVEPPSILGHVRLIQTDNAVRFISHPADFIFYAILYTTLIAFYVKFSMWSIEAGKYTVELVYLIVMAICALLTIVYWLQLVEIKVNADNITIRRGLFPLLIRVTIPCREVKNIDVDAHDRESSTFWSNTMMYALKISLRNGSKYSFAISKSFRVANYCANTLRTAISAQSEQRDDH